MPAETAPFVLMYHSVQAYRADPYRVTVRPGRFEEQLRWLDRRGRRGVSVRDLLRARRAGRGAGLVGLTFDDGYADFATQALPALCRHGFTATVFVVAGSLGGRNAWDEPGPRKELLTAGQVREIAAAGMEIGSHNLCHVHLPRLDPAQLNEQVRRSRQILAALTGEPVIGFCYPYGDAGPRETAAVAAAGYEYACAAGRDLPTGSFTLPRTFVGDHDTSPRLYAKLIRHRLTTGWVPV
ncbi:polysaccharide deacetylase family protein [Actinoplanes oblitus]|uniref:Polysaccharide deacetylase family protein n=1 Tax=Actinoplanes oblitus TaxID=3040509 RepID=A0ABY8W4U8_9ACTN|nr:polysaccharide deacetylase family protein [Actinoplanes oblitus]WIM92884.1 polysaccharide deacetylase family protein [Actinoplanes oblitus]